MLKSRNMVKYCKKCKRKTKHIKRGFGEVGGLCGNARLECLECEKDFDLTTNCGENK